MSAPASDVAACAHCGHSLPPGKVVCPGYGHRRPYADDPAGGPGAGLSWALTLAGLILLFWLGWQFQN